MEAKTHTHGPLGISRRATPDYAPQYGVYVEGGARRDIATVMGDNAEADARLFAAAPDMLAALKAMVTELDSGNNFEVWERACQQMRAAIAKAVQS